MQCLYANSLVFLICYELMMLYIQYSAAGMAAAYRGKGSVLSNVGDEAIFVSIFLDTHTPKIPDNRKCATITGDPQTKVNWLMCSELHWVLRDGPPASHMYHAGFLVL